MNTFKIVIIFFISMNVFSAFGAEVIEGCQGEACDCFAAYSNVKFDPNVGKPAIKADRAFKLFKEASKKSKVLASYKAGVKAKPIRQEMHVIEKGEYIVTSEKEGVALKKGDKLDTLIQLGEGEMQARFQTKWVNFNYEGPELKTIKETKIEEWLLVSVKGIQGYTQDSPFYRCLE